MDSEVVDSVGMARSRLTVGSDCWPPRGICEVRLAEVTNVYRCGSTVVDAVDMKASFEVANALGRS